MKRITAFLPIFLLAVSSCSDGITQAGHHVAVNIGLSKDSFASVSGGTGAVYSIFDSRGMLEYRSEGMEDESQLLDLRCGHTEIWAVSGIPPARYSGTLYLDDFLDTKVYFSDNAPGVIPAFGCWSADLSETGPSACSVSLRRYLSRIRLESVENAFEFPESETDAFFVGAFIENIPSDVLIDGSADPDCGYVSPGGRSGTGFLLDPGSSLEGAFPDLSVLDCRNSPLPVPAGESCAVPVKDLFSFRHSGSRMVRLVVVMDIDGCRRYYPVDLDFLRPNESWTINLKLTKLGSRDPDVAVYGAQSAIFVPSPFEDGPSLDITY